MSVRMKDVRRARILSGSVILLVAACAESRGEAGGTAPHVAGDFVLSIPSFTVVCTDGSSFFADGASEVIRVTQSGNAIALRSITFSAETIEDLLGVEILDTRQSGRVRGDSAFSIEKSATLRDPFDGEIYNVGMNADGRFKEDAWGGQVRYSLGSGTLKITCNGQAPFFGARIDAGGPLRSEPSRTDSIPLNGYHPPGFAFQTDGARGHAPGDRVGSTVRALS